MPPKCKQCGKEMKPKHKVVRDFMEVVQVILDAISTSGYSIAHPKEFACLGKIKNPKYDEWVRKYKENLKQSQGLRGLLHLKPKHKIPPNPPPMYIPCPNHYRLAARGEYNEKIVKKRNRPLYNRDGNPIIKVL